MAFAWRLGPAVGLLTLELACARGTPTASAVAPVHPGAFDASDGRGRSDAAAKSTPDGDAGKPAGDGAATTLRVIAAGDIACDGCGQSATAGLIEQLIAADHVTAVLALGDLAYSSGSAAEFRSFYAPTWGRPDILRISHPVPGNHEYASGSADDYFDYFNGAEAASGPAGPRAQGYYSFDLGPWHVIGLNSSDECRFVPCTATSAQYQWLVADLAAHPAGCTIAFWHHPRFQAGTTSGELAAAAPLWNALYDAGVEVVLNGHEHGYQQLSGLDKDGHLDVARGIRTFVVGTGGGDYDVTFGGPRLGALETSIAGTHGVLELTLLSASYQWQFIAVDGSKPPAASGSGLCH